MENLLVFYQKLNLVALLAAHVTQSLWRSWALVRWVMQGGAHGVVDTVLDDELRV